MFIYVGVNPQTELLDGLVDLNEQGYVIAGEVMVTVANESHHLGAGDVIHLTAETPSQWKNAGDTPVRLIWFNLP